MLEHWMNRYRLGLIEESGSDGGDGSEEITDITFVLDRSGSMEAARLDTQGGFDAFVRSQQELPGHCRFTLVQFDTQDPFEIVYDAVPVNDVVPLVLEPRSGTPLLDAIGNAIHHTERRLQRLQGPVKPIFVILTDGCENSSTDFDRAKVYELISKRTEAGWEFVYLGANQDAIQEGGNLGVSPDHSMTYSQEGGTTAAFSSLSETISLYRTGERTDMTWRDDDRSRQKGS